MQTFLPYPDFKKSAEVLDYQRLGKQRVEAKQILEINCQKILNPKLKLKWENHPAVLMWRGYEKCLSRYGVYICLEWIKRGYKDNLLDTFFVLQSINERIRYPEWFGLEEFHISHQSNLLRKDFDYYSKYFDVPNNLPYYWPVKKEE